MILRRHAKYITIENLFCQLIFQTSAQASLNKKRPAAAGRFLFGAGDEARTRYLHLGKVALYQMSYTRIWCLRSESNQRHGDFQSPALPTELQRHISVSYTHLDVSKRQDYNRFCHRDSAENRDYKGCFGSQLANQCLLKCLQITLTSL